MLRARGRETVLALRLGMVGAIPFCELQVLIAPRLSWGDIAGPAAPFAYHPPAGFMGYTQCFGGFAINALQDISEHGGKIDVIEFTRRMIAPFYLAGEDCALAIGLA